MASDEFMRAEMPITYEQKIELRDWVARSLRAGSTLSVEDAREHLVQYYGFEEGVADQLIDYWNTAMDKFDAGTRETSSARGGSRWTRPSTRSRSCG